MESIFSADCEEKLTKAERATLTSFEAAATKFSRPIVRKTCRDAGFVGGAQNMRTDPIFLAFQKWVRWATATPRNSPTTGLVVGDTWKDFCREYCGGNQRVMYFVVKDAKDKPDKNIVNGYVHVKGFLTDCTLSVNNAVSMRRLLKAQLGCLVVDLEMLLLSLLFPELDGIPVLQQVTKITDADEDIKFTVSLLLTHGHPYDYWPMIASVPSFKDHKKVDKDLCVGQLIGLMQFSRVPRHPIKGAGSDGRSANWALSSGHWTTTLHEAAQAALHKRRREDEVVYVDD